MKGINQFMCDKKDYVLLERLRKLIDTDTRENIAKSLGCDTSYITKHYNGNRPVTIEYLYKYSKHFNVSADYLLGFSEPKTKDDDLRFVCDYTGLNEETIKFFAFQRQIDKDIYFYANTIAFIEKLVAKIWNSSIEFIYNRFKYTFYRTQIKAKIYR